MRVFDLFLTEDSVILYWIRFGTAASDILIDSRYACLQRHTCRRMFLIQSVKYFLNILWIFDTYVHIPILYLAVAHIFVRILISLMSGIASWQAALLRMSVTYVCKPCRPLSKSPVEQRQQQDNSIINEPQDNLTDERTKHGHDGNNEIDIETWDRPTWYRSKLDRWHFWNK